VFTPRVRLYDKEISVRLHTVAECCASSTRRRSAPRGCQAVSSRYYNALHGHGQTQTRSARGDVDHDDRVADGCKSSLLPALEYHRASISYFRLLLVGYFEGIDSERGTGRSLAIQRDHLARSPDSSLRRRSREKRHLTHGLLGEKTNIKIFLPYLPYLLFIFAAFLSGGNYARNSTRTARAIMATPVAASSVRRAAGTRKNPRNRSNATAHTPWQVNAIATCMDARSA
jgi:hypothetical protein